MQLPPAPLGDGYDVCGPQATRVGKKITCATVPVFIHLQKACGSANRTLFWQVLARFRVLPPMTEAHHQFHGGTRACVRNDAE